MPEGQLKGHVNTEFHNLSHENNLRENLVSKSDKI
jgi:hypothetical protein